MIFWNIQVDATTNDNYTALHIAVESAKPAVVETLLGYGAEVHVRGGKLRETPLHIASRVPDGDRCALMLLKSGAGPNLTTDDGQTPVHVAASHGNLTTLLLLLDDGGDPMFKSKVNKTTLKLNSQVRVGLTVPSKQAVSNFSNSLFDRIRF